VVEDKSGAVIPGAKVMAYGDAGQLEAQVHAGPDGRALLDLPPGPYSIIVKAEAFATGKLMMKVEKGGAPSFVMQLALGEFNPVGGPIAIPLVLGRSQNLLCWTICGCSLARSRMLGVGASLPPTPSGYRRV